MPCTRLVHSRALRSSALSLILTLFACVEETDPELTAPAELGGDMAEQATGLGASEAHLRAGRCGPAPGRCGTLKAAPPGTSELRAALDALDPTLKESNFAAPLDALARTPDGGSYQFYAGSRDIGALYWHPQRSPSAHAVHGAILERWAELGYEAGLGYPQSEEQPAGEACAARGGLREQHFEMLMLPRELWGAQIGTARSLCWLPGETWLLEQPVYAPN